MTKILTGAGLLAVSTMARAHDSLVPHTHTIENGRPDLFYLVLAGIVASLLAGFALRSRMKRGEAKPVRTRKRTW